MDNRKSEKIQTRNGTRLRYTGGVMAVLDRCGNNWKNGKGGCGIMVNEEYTPCLATMFLPFIFYRRIGNRNTKCT